MLDLLSMNNRMQKEVLKFSDTEIEKQIFIFQKKESG